MTDIREETQKWIDNRFGVPNTVNIQVYLDYYDFILSILEKNTPVLSDDIKALNTINQARASGLFCCLTIYSDYDFCWEIKWVKSRSKSHKEHSTLANDTLIGAAQEFCNKSGFSPA